MSKKLRIAVYGALFLLFGLLPVSSSAQPGCYSYSTCYGSGTGGVQLEDPFAEFNEAAFQQYVDHLNVYSCAGGPPECPLPGSKDYCRESCMLRYTIESMRCASYGAGSYQGVMCFERAINDMANCLLACEM